MPDVMVWVTKPSGEDVPDLRTVGDEVKRLGHVSGINIWPAGNVIHVWFKGSEDEQEQIERTIREAGYELFKVSRRGVF